MLKKYVFIFLQVEFDGLICVSFVNPMLPLFLFLSTLVVLSTCLRSDLTLLIKNITALREI